jgi:hypothetical protein
VGIVEGRTQPFEPHDVQVKRSRADRVASRQRHPGSAGASKQRPEDTHRSANPSYMLVIGFVTECGRHGDGDLRRMTGDLGAQPTQDLAHDRHVDDVGHPRQGRGAFSQERGGHYLEHAVLGAGHGDVTRQASPAGDLERVHISMVEVGRGSARRGRAVLHGAPDPHLHAHR